MTIEKWGYSTVEVLFLKTRKSYYGYAGKLGDNEKHWQYEYIVTLPRDKRDNQNVRQMSGNDFLN